MSNSSILNQYNNLKADISELTLPNVIPATLKTITKQLTADKLLTAIREFSATDGWVQYTDKLVISTAIPTNTCLLEAQYTARNNRSLHVKLLSNNVFSVTEYQLQSSTTTKQFYTRQTLNVRNNLKEHAACVVYNTWWEMATTAEQEGRWLPLAQQFVGFTSANSNSKDT